MTKKFKNFDDFIKHLTDSLDELSFVNIIGFYEDEKYELTDDKEWITDDHIYLKGDKTFLVPKSLDLNKLAYNILEAYDDRPICPPQVFVGYDYRVWENDDKFSCFKYVCVSWAGE